MKKMGCISGIITILPSSACGNKEPNIITQVMLRRKMNRIIRQFVNFLTLLWKTKWTRLMEILWNGQL